MSFSTYKKNIDQGDTVILYEGINSMYALKVELFRKAKNGDEVENICQTSFGGLKVRDLIGKPYGTKVPLIRGYVYVLHPTPELWTKTLPHRTQILYATDIAMILMNLELKPGSVVVESGTGSGSLSHSIARTIAPNGHLHTFDFHEQRVELARAEFKSHGLDHLITTSKADACKDGFGLSNIADAVFLDLPHPWEAVPHAKSCLNKKSGGRICSFSPCIEQVQKTCSKLSEEGFIDVITVECLLREYQVKRISQVEADMDCFSVRNFNNPSKSDIFESAMDEPSNSKLETTENEPEEKRIKKELPSQDDSHQENKKKAPSSKSFVSAIPMLSMPGHTGYLTFATLKPKPEISAEEKPEHLNTLSDLNVLQG